jgi:hypothetical protein
MTEEEWEVIHSYSRAQAIEDGVLVDVSEVAREAGVKVPTAMTREAWEDLVRWDQGNWQDEAGRLWDVVSMFRFQAAAAGSEDRITVRLLRVPNRPNCHRALRASFVAVIGPGDTPEPVLTFMLDGED